MLNVFSQAPKFFLIWKYVVRNRPTLAHLKFCSTLSVQPTIFAQASSPGKAGVSVIRISGSKTKNVIQRMLRNVKTGNIPTRISPRTATLKKVVNPTNEADILDIALILWFPAPHSYTGEDILELHLHGGNIIVKNTLEALKNIPGCRLAEPGEFSKRAFYNNKMDLTEIEGLADLINAETEAQRIQALSQAQGILRVLYDGWRADVVSAMANVETAIEFSEEESIDSGLFDAAQSTILKIAGQISSHLSDNNRGEIVRNGLRIALIGSPNVGKSTIINTLAQRNVAIVSHIAGTTRDVIETSINISGYQAVVIDTAGIRESADDIEKQGIGLALQRAKDAHIKIIVLDSSTISNSTPRSNSFEGILHISEFPNFRGSKNDEPILTLDDNTYFIINKSDLSIDKNTVTDRLVDLLCDKFKNQVVQKSSLYKKVWPISCKSGSGWDDMLSNLASVVRNRLESNTNEPVFLTRERHRQHLNDTITHLNSFLDMNEDSVVESAEELRSAANSIGKITGKIDTQEVLTEIFSQFCIGK